MIDNSIFVKKVQYQGFKNSIGITEVELSDYTKLKGKNGVGKSTVGEAIAWGFLGSNLSGNTRADSKLMNNHVKKMYVRILFNDGEKDQILLRYRSKSTHIYILDGTDENWETPIKRIRGEEKEINQKDINIDPDMFLSIFSQEFFPNLTTDKAKKIILSLVPNVSTEEILDELSDFSKKILEGYDMNFPQNLLKEKKSRLKDIKEDILYLDGSKGTLKKIIRETEESLEDTIDEDRYKDLMSQKEMLKESGPCSEVFKDRYRRGLAVANRVIATREKEKDEIEYKEPELTDTKKQYEEISELEKDIIKIKNQEVKGLEDTAILNADIKRLEKEIQTLKDLQSKGGDCPTCNRPIEEDSLNPIINRLEKELQDKQDKVSKIENKNEKLTSEHEKLIAAKVEKINIKIKDIKEEIKDIEEINKEMIKDAKLEYKEKIQKANESIQEAKDGHDKMKDSFEKQKEEFQKEYTQKLEELNEEIQSLEKIKDKRQQQLKTIDENEKKLDEVNKKIKDTYNNEKDINVLINTIKEFLGKKIELETNSINMYFDNASLVLTKFVKSTGELKDCFELAYEGKDYKVLSTGEKIRLFVEISNLVSCMKGIDYPVFIDQCESVTKYNSFSTQIIEGIHDKNIKNLKVINDIEEDNLVHKAS